MKLAIIGNLPATISYHDWISIFRHHFWKKSISEFSFTGGNTLLNSYVRTYATKYSIPISVYSLCNFETKLARNTALIQNADLVVAFTTNATTNICSENAIIPHLSRRKALIINTDEYSYSNNQILKNTMTNQDEISREELITVEEEVSLIRQIQHAAEDSEIVERAKEKLILANRRFIKIVAQKYACEEYPLTELIAVGNKSLVLAAQKFDETQGFKFISYAIYWVKQFIEQTINANSKLKNE